MTALLDKIEMEARQLSPEERERLAVDLLMEIDSVSLSEIDQAWIEEAERRYDDLISGRTEGIPAEEVFSSIRRELGWKR